MIFWGEGGGGGGVTIPLRLPPGFVSLAYPHPSPPPLVLIYARNNSMKSECNSVGHARAMELYLSNNLCIVCFMQDLQHLPSVQ